MTNSVRHFGTSHPSWILLLRFRIGVPCCFQKCLILLWPRKGICLDCVILHCIYNKQNFGGTPGQVGKSKCNKYTGSQCQRHQVHQPKHQALQRKHQVHQGLSLSSLKRGAISIPDGMFLLYSIDRDLLGGDSVGLARIVRCVTFPWPWFVIVHRLRHAITISNLRLIHIFYF